MGSRFAGRARARTGTPRLGYDAAGVLHGYTVQERSGNTVRWTDTYAYTYHVQPKFDTSLPFFAVFHRRTPCGSITCVPKTEKPCSVTPRR
jgi:hypothetical protein